MCPYQKSPIVTELPGKKLPLDRGYKPFVQAR